MMNSRSRCYRPAVIDPLEDRVVPSSGLGHAHAQISAAAVSTASSTYAAKMAKLQAELTTAGTQINAAYANFATAIRNIEATLIPSATSTAPNMLKLQESVAGQVAPLGTAVASAMGNISHIGGDATVIAGGISGATAGSLGDQLASLFEAASTTGSISNSDPVSVSSLPLLFAAVDSVISVSLQSTSIQGLLAGLGSVGFVPPTSTSQSPFSLTAFGTQTNASFSTFASSIRAAELNLPTDPSSSNGNGTIASVTAAGTTAADTLGTSLAASLTGTTAETFVQLRQPEESAAVAAFAGLIPVAAPTGTVPAAEIPLVYAIGEAAINSTYQLTAIQGYLIGKILA